MRHLHPDLVMPAGIQLDFHEGCGRAGIFVRLYYPVVEPRQFCPGCVFGTDAGCVGAAVFYHIILKYALRRLGSSHDNGAVIFPETRGSELAVQLFCGFWRLGEDQEPFYGLVQPVDDSQVWLAGPSCRPSVLPAQPQDVYKRQAFRLTRSTGRC